MTSTAGRIFLSGGVVTVLLGVGLWLLYIPSYNNCQDEWSRVFDEEECWAVLTIHNLAIIIVGAGFILSFVGVVTLILVRLTAEYAYFECPRCRAHINYQNSPHNCYLCGLPIDWSKARAPRK
jgi:hypothetical protein